MSTTAASVSIVPSVLPADLARLGDEVMALEKAGVDRIQWDVMDGRFVPNLTFGPDVIAAVRPLVELPFEAHLMVELEVDGGIGPDTVSGAVRAGARVLVAGSALYRDPDGLAHAVADLRARAEEACRW